MSPQKVEEVFRSPAQEPNAVIKALWMVWRNKFLAFAAVLSSLEALISLGIDIPGIEMIPQEYRATVIVVIMGASFVLRVVSQRREDQYHKDQKRAGQD